MLGLMITRSTLEWDGTGFSVVVGGRASGRPLSGPVDWKTKAEGTSESLDVITNLKPFFKADCFLSRFFSSHFILHKAL